MQAITVVIIEDRKEYSDALKAFLESQTMFPCRVVVLNPNREKPPTFEEFHDEITSHASSWNSIILMDNQLGKWKWSGSHLAPSFHPLIAISTERFAGAEWQFCRKADIALRDDAESKEELLENLRRAFQKYMPPDWVAEMQANMAAKG